MFRGMFNVLSLLNIIKHPRITPLTSTTLKEKCVLIVDFFATDASTHKFVVDFCLNGQIEKMKSGKAISSRKFVANLQKHRFFF